MIRRKKIPIIIGIIICLISLIGSKVYYDSKLNKVHNNLTSDVLNTSTPKQIKEEGFNTDNIFVSGVNGYKIFIKNSNEKSNNYIGYSLQHLIKELDQEQAVSNFDVWKLSDASEYTRKSTKFFDKNFQIVTEGEWELAIQEEDTTDFVGGSVHGDEITTSVEIYLDGKLVDTNQKIDEEVKEFKLVTTSDLFRDSTITEELEKIAKHKKIYIFNKDGLFLDQEVEFLESIKLIDAYLAMLPILREKEGKSITNMYSFGDNKESFDVSNENIGQREKVETNKAVIFGEESKVNASLEILEKSPAIPTLFHVWNAPNYNKMYFNFIENTYQTEDGEVWKQSVHYNINSSN